jgi:Right handed beta helix region
MGRGVGRAGASILVPILAMAILVGCTADPEPGNEGQVTTPTFRPGTVDTTIAGPLVGQLVIERESARVIEGLVISNPDGDCVTVTRSTDIVIRDSVIGPCAGKAVTIRRSEGIRIEDSDLTDSAAGVYALDSQAVAITGNIFTNAGRNPVQFDKVDGPGNIVSNNEIHNEAGSSDTEDSINIYQSSGTETSPLLVEGNLVFNGGSSGSGSGILVGDNGGANLVVRGNVLINPGQAGIGVAGGRSIRVVDNTVFSESFPWSNVGIYVWDQYRTRCGEIEVSGNVVQWLNRDGAANPWHDAGNCGEIVGWEMNQVSSDLRATLADLYGELFE